MTNQSLDMIILSSTSVSPAYGGDFCAKVTENGLLIHPDTLNLLNNASVKTQDVIHFLSYIQTFPNTIALALGWETDQVEEAYEKLKTQLSGYLPENILNPKHTKRGYGALPPKPKE